MNYELCCSRLKKTVLLKFLGKKMDGAAKNGLLVRLTILYGKSSVASYLLITGRKHFSESVMVSVAVSKAVEFLQRTVPNFIELSVSTQQPGLKSSRLCCLGALQHSVHRKSHSSFQPDDLEDRVRTCWESWPTDHQQVHWSVAWQTEGSSSSEWSTHWTVVMNIWFICCVMLCLCNVSLCVLRICVRFAIVYRALPWSCDKK